MEATAPRPTSTSLRADTRPRTPLPGFVLDKGRFTTFDAPPGPLTFILANNNRGQIVGASATTGRPIPDGPRVSAAQGQGSSMQPPSATSAALALR